MPGRPTAVEHRDPADDLRGYYDNKQTAAPLTKLHAVTIMASDNPAIRNSPSIRTRAR